MKIIKTAKYKELQKYGFIFSEVNENNIEYVFSQILNYRTIKTAQAVKRRKKTRLVPERAISTVLERKIMSIANKTNKENRAVSAKQISQQLGITSKQVLEILRKNKFSGQILGAGAGNKIPAEIIQTIIDIQKEALSQENSLPVRRIIEIVQERTGRLVSKNTIARTLAENNLASKGQKRDPLLANLLHKLWSSKNKGIWKTLSEMDEVSQMQSINNIIDNQFKNLKDKKILKEYFLSNKIQLRDTVINKPIKNRPKQNPILNRINPIRQQEILNHFKNGLSPEEISTNTKLNINTVNEVLNNYNWKNFQFDPNHPSNFLGKQNELV